MIVLRNKRGQIEKELEGDRKTSLKVFSYPSVHRFGEEEAENTRLYG